MKRFLLFALLISACQPANEAATGSSKDKPKLSEPVAADVKAGVVRLRLNKPVSEPLACIIPISVENGLEATARVTMIAFSLTGPGDDSKGNMFAPAADAGAISEARVIVEGQSCDAYDTLSIPELRCTSGEESCEDKVEFIDGDGLRFAQTG